MSFAQEDLDHFKTILQVKRAEALGELGELERSSRSKNEGASEDRSTYSLHMADHGTDAMEREKSLLYPNISSSIALLTCCWGCSWFCSTSIARFTCAQ